MQENPFPSKDYIRVVTSDGSDLACRIQTESGQLWAFDNEGRTYERLECIDSKGSLANSIVTNTGSSDVNLYEVKGIDLYGHGKLKIFDASKSLSFANFKDWLYGGTMELIDISNCKLKTLQLTYGSRTPHNDNWGQTYAKKIIITGCVNAEHLSARGVNSSSKLVGIETCKNFKFITLSSLNLYDKNEKLITQLDLTIFPNLTTISIAGNNSIQEISNGSKLTTMVIVSCPSITSLDNLPSGLTSLNCSNCTGISSLDKLPSGLTTLDCSRCTGVTSLDNLPAGLTTLSCGETGVTSLDNLPRGLTSLGCANLNLSKADFSNTIIDTISAYGLKVQDGIFAPPITLKSFSAGDNKIKQGDFSQCVNLGTFGACGDQWMIGKLLLPPSIKTLGLGTSWGTWVYPMPDLTACTNLTSINCQRCTNIPNLDQQAFIDSLPTFTDGSTHTINLKNTGVVAETVAAIQAKGWIVQI
jgi:hypothetical protein